MSSLAGGVGVREWAARTKSQCAASEIRRIAAIKTEFQGASHYGQHESVVSRARCACHLFSVRQTERMAAMWLHQDVVAEKKGGLSDCKLGLLS